MQGETRYRIIFMGLFFTLIAVRGYYHRQGRSWERGERHVGWNLLHELQFLAGLPVFGAMFVYIFRPEWMAWGRVPLPDGLRWTGAIAGFGSLGLLVWVQHSLGKNFSTLLRIRFDHTLVTYGPYRWVRHPMYTTLLLLSVAILLLTANWLIGGAWILAILLVMIVRTPFEERMMMEKFGDEYRQYMRRTGKFIRLW